MQYGIVNDALEGWITLTVLGDDGAGERHEFFIDTGFYGELTLSQDVIDRLNLPVIDCREVVLTLAGGSTRTSNLYTASIFWHGRLREVNVVSLETDHLIGMRLLRGSNLLPVIDCREVVLTLAGGSTRTSNLYTASIFWHGRLREVNVVSLETDHLIGMRLLRGSNLNVDAVPGGSVTITELVAAGP